MRCRLSQLGRPRRPGNKNWLLTVKIFMQLPGVRTRGFLMRADGWGIYKSDGRSPRTNINLSTGWHDRFETTGWQSTSLVTAFLKVTTWINCLPGLNGSCSSAHQPKGTSKETITKRRSTRSFVTLYILLASFLEFHHVAHLPCLLCQICTTLVEAGWHLNV